MYKQLKRQNESFNIVELAKENKEIKIFIDYLEKEIEELKDTLKSPAYGGEVIVKKNDNSDLSNIMIKIEKYEIKLQDSKERLLRLEEITKKLEENYKLNKERNKLIYLEYYLKNYSSIKIGMIHGISDRQVRNIIKNIQNNINKV